MQSGFSYSKISQDSGSPARTGRIKTAHGEFSTPAFMPVGTQGSVKGLTQEMLEQAGAGIILGNTYHLYLRPGHLTINKLGGLHKFIAWDRSILTDSGGFQVFSLGPLRRISEEGVEFQSHIDGSRHLLSPEKSMEIQAALGSDIIMSFDECTHFPATREEAERSLDMTSRWAARSKKHLGKVLQGSCSILDAESPGSDRAARSGSQQDVIEPVNRAAALFGINQGSVYTDLRERSLEQLIEIGFDGYAIGGLSVGEEKDQMFEVVSHIAPGMPEDRPRYLMGVGSPEDIVNAVAMGIDMFDCVMPTRNARNGQLFTSTGRINIKNAKYREDAGPLDANCACPVCSRYSRAYIRHLYFSGEILASVLNTFHNVWFYLDTMARIRQAIELGTFTGFRTSLLSNLAGGLDSE